MQTSKTYRANGKLLLFGEYLVLKGGKALAIPIKYGQRLKVKSNKKHFLSWHASGIEGHWFSAYFDKSMNIIESDNIELANQLSIIIKACINLNSKSLIHIENKEINTYLEFNRNWGFGSSSTLVSCLSQWLNIDAYELLRNTFGGSAYDIACATTTSSISFQLINHTPEIITNHSISNFSDRIYFIYLGQKQSSRNEITRFYKLSQNTNDVENINNLCNQISLAKNVTELGQLIEQHEKLIGNAINLTPIKEKRFSSFNGYIKSLGAWGGDFIMAVTDENKEYVKSYFNAFNMEPIFSYNDLIINNNETNT